MLILLDVLAWSPRETAAALGITAAAVNSALQRAHATMDAYDGEPSSRVADGDHREVVAAFMVASEHADPAALAELLAEDARLVMPPFSLWLDGRSDVIAFLERRFREHGVGEWRLFATAPNRQPACGIDRRLVGETDFERVAIAVLRIGGDGIEDITLFLDDPALFDLFELPEVG